MAGIVGECDGSMSWRNFFSRRRRRKPFPLPIPAMAIFTARLSAIVNEVRADNPQIKAAGNRVDAAKASVGYRNEPRSAAGRRGVVPDAHRLLSRSSQEIPGDRLFDAADVAVSGQALSSAMVAGSRMEMLGSDRRRWSRAWSGRSNRPSSSFTSSTAGWRSSPITGRS